ncbi:LapA family protein [Sphingobacterium sp.]|uniref:LapA family protein n=1 Tax=Sphingobacterium sp. TaxID=341027 RepID=UPI0031D202B1
MRNILLIVLSVIVTLVCVKNTQTIDIDLIATGKIALWKLLLAFFAMGVLFAFLLKAGKKAKQQENSTNFDPSEDDDQDPKPKLSDEDRDFLS